MLTQQSRKLTSYALAQGLEFSGPTLFLQVRAIAVSADHSVLSSSSNPVLSACLCKLNVLVEETRTRCIPFQHGMAKAASDATGSFDLYPSGRGPIMETDLCWRLYSGLKNFMC